MILIGITLSDLCEAGAEVKGLFSRQDTKTPRHSTTKHTKITKWSCQKPFACFVSFVVKR